MLEGSTTTFKVLFAVTEADPLVKIGGLGDVAASLPRVLRLNGHDVRLVMPRYGIINLEGYKTTMIGSLNVRFIDREESVNVTRVEINNGVPVYLLGNSRYFDRHSVYGEADDLERFLLFSLAALEVPKLINWSPDILHCHDWHTGIIPALLNTSLRNYEGYSSCGSVFTIHNLGYQGWFSGNFADYAGLDRYLPPIDDPVRQNSYSMLALGIYHCDYVSTVSETYAAEILTPEYGMGLESLLQRRQDSLVGILNGLDYRHYNPAKDKALAAHYTDYLPDRRIRNKISLIEKAGLPAREETPLIGMVGRVVWQKGFDIAIEAIRKLLAEDIFFVLQGTGDPFYEEQLRALEAQFPDKCRMFLILDFSLADLIFAGCDILIAPSRYEPCGLSVPIAMRYGAIPVVRSTGGLSEMVTDCSSDLANGTGFVFKDYNADSLVTTIRRAVDACKNNKDKWHGLITRVMKADFSWQTSIPKYEKLYDLAKQRRIKSISTAPNAL